MAIISVFSALSAHKTDLRKSILTAGSLKSRVKAAVTLFCVHLYFYCSKLLTAYKPVYGRLHAIYELLNGRKITRDPKIKPARPTKTGKRPTKTIVPTGRQGNKVPRHPQTPNFNKSNRPRSCFSDFSCDNVTTRKSKVVHNLSTNYGANVVRHRCATAFPMVDNYPKYQYTCRVLKAF